MRKRLYGYLLSVSLDQLFETKLETMEGVVTGSSLGQVPVE